MELLIPGLLLVALMVYASTRIKRVAAEAFEAELVDTAEFVLEKPEGFLNVVSPAGGLSLQIYSKDYGINEASDFRAARGEVRVYEKRTLKFAATAIRESTAVTSEVPEIIDGRKYIVFEAESVEKGIGFREMYKLAEKDGSVIELKIKAVEDIGDELSKKIDAILASFILK